jgi:hypothetical protein
MALELEIILETEGFDLGVLDQGARKVSELILLQL